MLFGNNNKNSFVKRLFWGVAIFIPIGLRVGKMGEDKKDIVTSTIVIKNIACSIGIFTLLNCRLYYKHLIPKEG